MAVGFSGSKACLTSDSETFVNFFLSRKTSIVRFLRPRLGELTFDCPGGKFNCRKTPHLAPTSEAIRLMISYAVFCLKKKMKIPSLYCLTTLLFHSAMWIHRHHHNHDVTSADS